jgi:hypothetical protein
MPLTTVYYYHPANTHSHSLILPPATSCENTAPLAEKITAALPEVLAHIVYFFH